MEAAFRDYMEWCIDWALHRFQQLAYVSEEMAPQGLRNMAYDLCQQSWDSTSELRGVVRSACERLPHGVRPTWLWTERRDGTDYRPAGDRTPSPRGPATYEELEEIEAYAIRKGPVPDGHSVLDTACLH